MRAPGGLGPVQRRRPDAAMSDPSAATSARPPDRISSLTADSLTEFALETLLATPEGWRSLVREATRRWPDAPPLAIVFAMVNASAQIEAIFSAGSPARAAAQHGFRLAGLLSADLYAMQTLGLPHARAEDLTRYWQNHDDYFLTL